MATEKVYDEITVGQAYLISKRHLIARDQRQVENEVLEIESQLEELRLQISEKELELANAQDRHEYHTALDLHTQELVDRYVCTECGEPACIYMTAGVKLCGSCGEHQA